MWEWVTEHLWSAIGAGLTLVGTIYLVVKVTINKITNTDNRFQNNNQAHVNKPKKSTVTINQSNSNDKNSNENEDKKR